MRLELLHLCDSLFPIGGFAYSDGLESATSTGTISDSVGLQAWLEAVLDDTIGRLEGPAVWHAWRAVADGDVAAMIQLDEELTALRPSSSARRSSRAMGQRLLTTWQALHPDVRLERLALVAKEGAIGPVLPLAFAAACVSAAMRLMPFGQTDAHRLLSRTLERVPAVVDRIAAGNDEPESFTPMMDIAAMTQQYLHSRLFRS